METSSLVQQFYKQVAKNFFKELDDSGCRVDPNLGDPFYNLLNKCLTGALDATLKSSELIKQLENQK